MYSATLLVSLLAVLPVFAHAQSPAPIIVTGVVLGPDGRPVPDARISLVALSDARVLDTTATGRDGRFAFPPYAPPSHGVFELIVSASGLRSEPATTNGASPVTIHMAVAAVAEAVVVSAAQVDVPLSRVTDSVDVISSADLRLRQSQSIADALRAVPALGVTASGGPGAVTSLFTRGGESDYTLVLVDGVAVNEFGGSVDIAHLSTAGVDRIEVINGPQSALHGSGALSGVVQVRSAAGGPGQATVLLESGSAALKRAAAAARASAGAWDLGGAAEHLDTAGFTGLTSTGARVANDDYRRTDISGVAARRVGGRSRARLTARWNDNSRGFPGPFGSDPAGTYGGIDTISRGENTQSAVSGAAEFGHGRIMHDLGGSWMDLDSRFASPFGPSESSTRRAAFRYAADIAFGQGAGATAGFDVSRESARSTFIVDRAGAGIPVARTIAGYFAEARAALGHRVLTTAGARLDQIHRDALAGDASPWGARPDLPADTVWSFNPRISALVDLSPAGSRETTRLRAGIATGIRPPSAFELSSTDNPSLVPERNRSFEIAADQTLARGAMRISAAMFWNQYDDLIISVQSLAGASRYRSANLSNARARGIELSATARGTRQLAGFAVTAGYTWLDTEVLAADGAATTGLAPFDVGDALLRRPRHRGFAEATFTRDGISAFLSVTARGAARDVDPSYGLFGGLYDNDGYESTAVGATWAIAPALSVFARATNLFDRRYEEIFGFPAPGRRLAIGVRLAAGR